MEAKKQEIRDFEEEYIKAKAEYDLLGEAVQKLMEVKTDTLKEAIKKSDKIDKLMRKRMKLCSEQLKRDIAENIKNGITTPVTLRPLDNE